MKIGTLPRPFSDVEAVLVEGPIERFPLAANAAAGQLLRDDLFEICADHRGQRCVALNSQLSNLLDEFLVQRERHIHASHNKGNPYPVQPPRRAHSSISLRLTSSDHVEFRVTNVSQSRPSAM